MLPSGKKGFWGTSSKGVWKSVQAQRQRVEAILGEDATIDGLENVEVKVFK